MTHWRKKGNVGWVMVSQRMMDGQSLVLKKKKSGNEWGKEVGGGLKGEAQSLSDWNYRWPANVECLVIGRDI